VKEDNTNNNTHTQTREVKRMSPTHTISHTETRKNAEKRGREQKAKKLPKRKEKGARGL
jgi:redox-sensitive bicupin YhaK (pirin superfamily)